jgi:hypothetical protein
LELGNILGFAEGIADGTVLGDALGVAEGTYITVGFELDNELGEADGIPVPLLGKGVGHGNGFGIFIGCKHCL